jgi:MFS family permease
MTDTSSPAIAVADGVASTETALPFKGLVAVVVGNWLEFYDFLVFTFFAVMIGNAFFPGESEIARLLSALATLYLLESAPIEKRVALTAWQGYSQQLALVMGSLAGVILTATLSKQQLYDWGWRVPFVLGVFIAPVGLYIRRQLPETIARHKTHRSGAAVLVDLMRHHLHAVILGILIISGGTISTYVFSYMTTYAITTLHLSPTIGTALVLTGSLASIAGLALGVWADRFGRKPMLIVSRVLFVIIIYPAYLIITSPTATVPMIVTLNMLLNFIFSVGLGAAYAFLTEAFPRSVRSSGLGILYALGVTIFGGTTQFVVAWLIDWTKDPMVPAWYQMIANVAAIIGVMLLMPHAEVRRERAAFLAAAKA